jgi:hypothetical protein
MNIFDSVDGSIQGFPLPPKLLNLVPQAVELRVLQRPASQHGNVRIDSFRHARDALHFVQRC